MPSPVNNSSPSQSQTNPWLDLLKEIWENKFLVFSVVFIATILGIFVAKWQRPVYEANALLQVSKSKGNSLSAMLGDVGSLLGFGGSSVETESQLMQSRRILEEVIDSLGLLYSAEPTSAADRFFHREGRVDVNYIYFPDTSVMPLERRGEPWHLIADDSVSFSVYDDLKQKVLSGVPGTLASAPYQGDSVKIFVTAMKVRKGQKFQLVAASMVGMMKTVTGNLKVEEAGKKTGILNIAYRDEYLDRAKTIIDTLLAVYLRMNAEFGSTDMKNTLELLESQLPEARRALDSLMVELNAYREKIGSADIAAETKIALESQMRLQQQIVQLEQMREEKARLFDESHPSIVTTDKQIENLKKELAKGNSTTRKLPEIQQKILTLTTEAQFAQTIYSDLLKRTEQMRLLVAGTMESAKIIDPAEGNPVPVKPKKKIIVLAFMFVGFCGAIGLISLKNRFHGVTDPFQVSRFTGVRVYSCIEKGSAAVNGLRILLLSLELEIIKRNRVYCFTGLEPRVGNSFVASEMAKLFAKTGKKVLLVDANLQDGKIEKTFKISKKPGLVDMLASKIALPEVICKTSDENLHILQSGQTLMCSEGLFRSEKFANFVTMIRDFYDIVIFDAPPLLNSMDAAIIAKVSDEVVLTIESSKHSLESINDGMSILPKNLNKVITFNQCESKKS